MILSDRAIKEKIKTGEISIEPFFPENVQPASYDLHLDNEFRIFKPHETEIIDTKKPVFGFMEEVFIEEDKPFVLHPGSFALALIREKTGVDKKHVGRLEGKSSLARLGLLIHTTAGFLDPGNCLKLTLELFNASPIPIKLYPGMKIAQLAFETLEGECERAYGMKELNSKYFGADKIQESKMYLNFKENQEYIKEEIKTKITREFLSTVYVVKDEKVLLTWNKKVNKFIPVGGHIENGELPHECAIREAKEESGFDIEILNAREMIHSNLPQNLDMQVDVIKPDHHHINISFIGKIKSGEMLKESDEQTELKWFSKEEIINHPEIFDNTREKALKAIEFMKTSSP
jgi:dCTP deaminase